MYFIYVAAPLAEGNIIDGPPIKVLQDDQARATPFLKDFDNSFALYQSYAVEQKKQKQKLKRKVVSLDLTEGNELSGPLVATQVQASEDSDGDDQPDASAGVGARGGRRRRFASRVADDDNQDATADTSANAQFDF